MEFIIKKNKPTDTGLIKIQDLIREFKLDSLMNRIDKLEAYVEKMEKTSQITENNVINLINEHAILIGEPINLINAGSIEKNKDVKIGAIYFNPKIGKIRLKKKTGWITLKEDNNE